MSRKNTLSVRVKGVDGSTWHIYGPNQGAEGIVMELNQVGMLEETPVETIWQSAIGQIGGTFRGLNFEPRDVGMPVVILGLRSSREYVEIDSRWRRAWSYQEDSVIELVSNGQMRRLRCRLKRSPELVKQQPTGHSRGAARLLMHLIAGDPLWYSETVTEPWIFDGVHWTGHVTVENPTDIPMWLQWTVTGPASIILPDFSFETRAGFPGYEHRQRRIVLPHLRHKWDALVDSDPTHEQLAVVGKPNFWMLLEKPFLYPVPPRTPPTQLPLAVNPLPLLPEVWKRLDVPFDIPVEFLVKMAEILERMLTAVGLRTLERWSARQIAQRIRSALEQAAAWARRVGLVGEWLASVLTALSESRIADLIGDAWGHAWGAAFNLPGAGVQVRQIHRWTRPYGLE